MNLWNYVKCQWDRAGAVLCLVAGAAALLIGYVGVSGTRETADQIPYVVSGGMVGLFLLGTGAMLWLSADLRDEWRKLDAIDRHLLSAGSLPDREGPADAMAPVEATETQGTSPPELAQEISLR